MLGNTVGKMMSDKPNYFPETGVAWAIATKNSLEKVNSKIVAENLFAMRDGRLAFIKSESDEKLRQALWHHVRTSSEVKYVTGDKVYYKRRIGNC